MLSQQISQRQTLSIAPRQLQALKLLAKSLPELRAELMGELMANPAIEGVEHPLETPLSDVVREADEREEPGDGEKERRRRAEDGEKVAPVAHRARAPGAG